MIARIILQYGGKVFIIFNNNHQGFYRRLRGFNFAAFKNCCRQDKAFASGKASGFSLLLSSASNGMVNANSLPLPGSLFKVIPPPSKVSQFTAYGQTKPRAAIFTARRAVSLLECFKYRFLLILLGYLCLNL